MQNVPFTERRVLIPFVFVTLLFTLWGVSMSMSDVLNKHFQEVLHLSKSQSGLIQFSVFGAYFVMSIPAGLFMKKFGYKPGVLLGLALFSAGTFLFIPAADNASFTLFRIALFVMGCGMATLETVAHPFMAALGHQATSDRRINFAQSFNAVGTMIGPALGTYFLLSAAGNEPKEELDAVKSLYGAIAVFVLIFGLVFSIIKIPALTDPHAGNGTPEKAGSIKLFPRELFRHRHFNWAVITQFFNVAAQAGTWAFFINYGHEKLGFTDEQAGNYMVLFMGMMVLGRIAGTFLMKFIAPNRILAAFAIGNILMCVLVAANLGWVSFVALLFINFFFSIMFPTIFSLGMKNLGDYSQQGSSFIAMGVVGGAFFPFIMGLMANKDVALAYLLPVFCYILIFLYGVKLYKADNPLKK
ncbi:MAG: L-fucose:H+ symporter permease [Niabella sp.]